MSNIGIKYMGAILDGSGYAEFSRNFIAAIYKSGLANICVEPISYESARSNYGEAGRICERLVKAKIDYQFKIINILPDNLKKKREAGKTNISFTMFETNRIPTVWVDAINKYSEACFVPCSWNKEVFESSGVIRPVKVVPPGLDTKRYQKMDKLKPISLDIPEDAFCFYSIFQWTERKNGVGLLKAYWSAFDEVEDVYLVLKTYRHSTSPQEQARLKEQIARVKASLRLKRPPKIVFVGGFLSKDEITGIHKRGDCFVLPHRAEGWGLPHIEAMAVGNPVITTGFSGNMDFMNKQNSYLLDYQMTPVCNMPWIPHYEASMEWAEPDLSQLKKYMRRVYENRKEAKRIGKKGQSYVLSNFSWETSARRFVTACEELSG